MTEATRDAAHTPLFLRHARRPRLTALLDDTRAQSILLTAPAGYGKTTLAREWLQGRDDVVWYQATPGSADVGAFSAGLSDAVGPIVPGAGERVRQRLRVGDATERLARPLAELLAEDLEPWPAGGIIVLDDYHLMAESAPVEDFLDWLLTLAPIRLLVTTRRRPGWASARRFLYGEAVEIGRDQLAMTDDEAVRVLEGRSTEAVRALVRQADGWPALIGLAALSSDLEFPPERVSESLFRYFAEEVLRREPEETQRLMLLASIGSSISVRTARDVLGFPDPEPILDRLRSEGLMEAARGGGTRFHPLLREFLRSRLRRAEPAVFAERARVLVEHARAERDWEEAFELSVETGTPEEAAEIAGLAARGLLAAGQSETLEKWLSALGAASVTVPGAALARAEILIRKGDMSAAATLAQDTARRLADDHPAYAWACNVAGRALHFRSQEQDSLAAFKEAERTARDQDDRKEALWGIIIINHELSPNEMKGRLDELEATYPDSLDLRLRLAFGHALAAERGWSIAEAWQQTASLLDFVRYSREPLAASGFLANAAAFQVMRGHYAEARKLADRAIAYCRQLRLDFALGTCLSHRASAEIGLRRFPQAARTIRQLARTSSRREDPFYRVEELTLRARLAAAQGAFDDAISTLDALPAAGAPARPLAVFYSTVALIQASRSDFASARDLIARVDESAHNIESRYCISLAQAVVDFPDPESPSFVRRATELIIQCDVANYLDGLIFACRLYPNIIRAATTSPQAASVLAKYLAMSRDAELASRFGLRVDTDHVTDVLSELTPREREVLALLSSGLSNTDIASRLYIAPSTAKVHVRRILKKLGVQSRLQAVLRAQELLDREEA